jgi:hypothetical protein
MLISDTLEENWETIYLKIYLKKKKKTHPKACLGDQALIMNKDKLFLLI